MLLMLGNNIYKEWNINPSRNQASRFFYLRKPLLTLSYHFANKKVTDVPIFLIILVHYKKFFDRFNNISGFFQNLSDTALCRRFIFFQAATRQHPIIADLLSGNKQLVIPNNDPATTNTCF